MKAKIVIAACSIQFTGCFDLMSRLSATRYKSIENNVGELQYTAFNDDVKVSINEREFGKNERMNIKSQSNNVVMKFLKIENRSDSDIIINKNDIAYAVGPDKYSPIGYEKMYKRSKLRTWTYLWWFPVFGYTYNCNNDDCSIFIIPVGLVYGTINGLVAWSGNTSMKEELAKMSWKADTIPPHGNASGNIYFKVDNSGYDYDMVKESYFKVIYKSNDSTRNIDVKARASVFN